jgi:hypothetical protein
MVGGTIVLLLACCVILLWSIKGRLDLESRKLQERLKIMDDRLYRMENERIR